MDIDIDRRPGETDVVLVVRGRLDAESAAELRHAVAAEVRQGVQAITLDLVETTFLSSAGIRVLFETQREARARLEAGVVGVLPAGSGWCGVAVSLFFELLVIGDQRKGVTV